VAMPPDEPYFAILFCLIQDNLLINAGTLPYRKYLMAVCSDGFSVLLLVYVFSDYSGTVKCKISLNALIRPSANAPC
jgi:hypothetical protein